MFLFVQLCGLYFIKMHCLKARFLRSRITNNGFLFESLGQIDCDLTLINKHTNKQKCLYQDLFKQKWD